MEPQLPAHSGPAWGVVASHSVYLLSWLAARAPGDRLDHVIGIDREGGARCFAWKVGCFVLLGRKINPFML